MSSRRKPSHVNVLADGTSTMRNSLVDTDVHQVHHEGASTIASLRQPEYATEQAYSSDEFSEFSDCEEQDFQMIGGVFKKLRGFGRAKKNSNKYASHVKRLTTTFKREIVAYNESTDQDIKANHRENIMGMVEEFRKLSTNAVNVRDRLLEKYERNKGTWASTAKGRRTKSKNIAERRKLDNVITSANSQITDGMNTVGASSHDEVV